MSPTSTLAVDRRTILRVAAGFVSGAACAFVLAMCSGGAAQTAGMTPQAQRAVTASMLRIAAEAADAFRTDAPVHVFVKYAPPHKPFVLFDPRLVRDELLQIAADSDAAYIGQFTTPGDRLKAGLIGVDSVIVWAPRGASGKYRRWKVDPRRVDLIAFTMPAIDKFVLPYYARVRSPVYADSLRRGWTNSNNTYMLYCHDPLSWECNPNFQDEG